MNQPDTISYFAAYRQEATSLFSHYSQMRALIALSLLTVSFGITVYLLQYLLGANPNLGVALFILVIQLLSFISVIVVDIYFSNLRWFTLNYLRAADKQTWVPKSPMSYMVAIASIKGSWKLRDPMDWFLVILGGLAQATALILAIWLMLDIY